jgi:1,4-dihydroxy-2-naphthoyl-CoA hydrolase
MVFNYYRTIHLADTDAAGVIYFARMLSICHEAYEVGLKTAGIDLKSFFQNSSVAIPIVHGEIDFFRPVFCGDELIIELTPKLLNETSFEINYLILGIVGQENYAKAKTKHVCINPETRKRVNLPDYLLKIFS